MYADDNDDALVPYSINYQNSFYTMLYSFLRRGEGFSSDPWRCPSRRDSISGWVVPGIMPVYGFGCGNFNSGCSGSHYIHSDWAPKSSFKRSQVKNPTATPSWIDSSQNAQN